MDPEGFFKIDKETQEPTGFFVDLIDEVFESLNMSYSLELGSNDFKTYNDLGKIQILSYPFQNYFPLVMSIARNEYDMLLGDITINSERVKIVDFSVPIQSANIILFMRKATKHEKQIFSFLQPLSDSVWLAILISLVIGNLFTFCYKISHVSLQ